MTIARSRASSSSVVSQMEARKQQWVDQRNTSYNFFWPNKWTEDAVYCAQLTWKSHLGTGRDLDSNDWRYYLYIWARYGGLVATLVVIPAVAPDEIGFSNNIYVVGSGRNF